MCRRHQQHCLATQRTGWLLSRAPRRLVTGGNSTLSQTIENVGIAAVGDQNLGVTVCRTRSAADGWDGLDQWENLGDVIAVDAGEDRG